MKIRIVIAEDVETGEIHKFKSVYFAAKWLVETEISKAKKPVNIIKSISDCLTGKYKTALGFKWTETEIEII